MSDIALRIEHLSKEYSIGARQASYRTLRDTIVEALGAPFRRVGKLLRGQAAGVADLDERIWALKDVSLEIKRGEVVGLIGRNGAGKSTLLKILARITEPTQGRAAIHGRVGSLLEVGTGFHAELTGRENIYLNGAILGMKRGEIARKFDEIVAFAEVEKFIDTPVKHYSSGMYLRLAFAVAAHLEPEILLVDEVLAVGDARFQRKCLNKMQDVGQQGRTVVFVSHSMPAITRLCARAILLEEGTVSKDGPAPQVVGAYLNSDLGTMARREWPEPEQRPGKDIARLCAVRVRTEQGAVVDTVDIRKPVGIEMEYMVLTSGYVLMPHYHFSNEEGMNIFSAHDTDTTWRRRPRPAGHYISTVWIPGNLLAEGMIFVDAALTTLDPNIHQFTEHQAVAFQVVDTLEGDSARGDWTGRMKGLVRPLMQWNTQPVPTGHDAVMPLVAEEAKL
jgi:lipopolysaccharide transport system ATP-binding protein